MSIYGKLEQANLRRQRHDPLHTTHSSIPSYYLQKKRGSWRFMKHKKNVYASICRTITLNRALITEEDEDALAPGTEHNANKE